MNFSVFTQLLWTGQPGEWLRDATLVVEDGLLVDIVAGKSSDAISSGQTAIIPTLVNTHCHLEFSYLKQPLASPLPFSRWISEITQARNDLADSGIAIQQGLIESQQSGIHHLADIVTQPVECYQNLPSKLHCHLFKECIGISDERISERQQSLTDFLQQTNGFSRGISPHAPYTVREDFLDWMVDQSATHQLPVMMHLAETTSELEFLADAKGELVEMLQKFGIWSGPIHPAGTTILDLLKKLSAVPRLLIAHGNYLTEAEMEFLANQPQMHVIYCPRTHAYFGHAPHPWRELLEKGINVAVGTDGRGSNPDLSILNELRFLHQQFPDTDPETLLQMGTINGGKALGMETAIQVGQPADFTMLSAVESRMLNGPGDLLKPGLTIKMMPFDK